MVFAIYLSSFGAQAMNDGGHTAAQIEDPAGVVIYENKAAPTGHFTFVSGDSEGEYKLCFTARGELLLSWSLRVFHAGSFICCPATHRLSFLGINRLSNGSNCAHQYGLESRRLGARLGACGQERQLELYRDRNFETRGARARDSHGASDHSATRRNHARHHRWVLQLGLDCRNE